MKSYKDIRRDMVGDQAPSEGAAMPCSSCKAMTPHETLRNLGGMCHACFEHYCDSAFDYEAQAARYKIGLERSRAGRGASRA